MRQSLGRHRPRKQTIQYSATLVIEREGRGVLDARMRVA